MDIYKKATKLKLRFESARGLIITEDLRDVPLLSDDGFCLDEIAKTVNRQLKSEKEESFVEEKTSGDKLLELKLAIVKDVIADKLKEKEEAENAAARKAKKEKLMGILERKQDAELEDMSAEEIRKAIEGL
jgi:hypothetical protein